MVQRGYQIASPGTVSFIHSSIYVHIEGRLADAFIQTISCFCQKNDKQHRISLYHLSLCLYCVSHVYISTPPVPAVWLRPLQTLPGVRPARLCPVLLQHHRLSPRRLRPHDLLLLPLPERRPQPSQHLVTRR